MSGEERKKEYKDGVVKREGERGGEVEEETGKAGKEMS